MPQSAYDYADICNAIYEGVHMTLLRDRRVACGVTSARGNNNPRARWSSVAPIGFLRAMHQAGVRRLDAYAHQPHPSGRGEPPWAKPKNRTAVTLGNIDRLVGEVTRRWGRKPIWLTELGYETSPPDRTNGVPLARQAQYLAAAARQAERHPRIDMLIWFLIRDEPRFRGWQSGLVTARGEDKPAFAAFRQAAHRITLAQAAAASTD